jgi:acyl-coenzyme A synthetase/AMP-(fatty) acid ligase
VRYVDDLPHTSTGKLDRASLRRTAAPITTGAGA